MGLGRVVVVIAGEVTEEGVVVVVMESVVTIAGVVVTAVLAVIAGVVGAPFALFRK